MLAPYIAALILGGGSIGLQLLLGGHGDGATGDVHEVHGGGADGHGSVPLHGAESAHASDGPSDAPGGHQSSGWSVHDSAGLLLTTRFWLFALLAFGMVGTLLTLLGAAGPFVTLLLATISALVSGAFSAAAFRMLRRSGTGTSAGVRDAIGCTGRVLVPVSRAETGQVRVQLRGLSVDLVASTEEEPALERGTLVLIEDVIEGAVHVVRAPKELE